MYKKNKNLRRMIVVNFIILCLIVPGWCLNIFKLTKCDFEKPYKAEIIRIIGIVPPVGAITGWMDFGK